MRNHKAARLTQAASLWYQRRGRKFAWRRNVTPWSVLVSSILLKKTPAARVEAVYRDLIGLLPTPAAAAHANVGRLRRSFRSLGHTWRFRDLALLSRELLKQHRGAVPRTEQELLRLRGVGPYVASAVRCYGFGEPVVVLDAVTGRVIRRVLGLPPANDLRDKELTAAAAKLVPPKPREARLFNYALLDIGAAYCKPEQPRCPECPLLRMCRFAKNVRDRDRRLTAPQD